MVWTAWSRPSGPDPDSPGRPGREVKILRGAEGDRHAGAMQVPHTRAAAAPASAALPVGKYRVSDVELVPARPAEAIVHRGGPRNRRDQAFPPRNLSSSLRSRFVGRPAPRSLRATGADASGGGAGVRSMK